MDGASTETMISRGRHPLREHARACGFTQTEDFKAALGRHYGVPEDALDVFAENHVRSNEPQHSVRAICKRLQPLRNIYAAA